MNLAPFLDVTLSGMFVVRNADAAGFDSIARTAATNYRGPDLGGIDVMPPNDAGEGWLIMGRWADCFVPEVRDAASKLKAALDQALTLANAGLTFTGGGNASLQFPPRATVEIVPWLAFSGGVSIPFWTWPPGERERLARDVWPSIPRYVGVRNGEPHWLGIGMQRDGASITSVTPYAKLRFVEGRGIELSGLAAEADARAWVAALRNVMRV